MIAKVFSAAVVGLESNLIEVEADISHGLPNFTIVGLPDTAIQEAKERVRSAIKNNELFFPDIRVVINLAPADIKKEGPIFDLPIALAILASAKQLPIIDNDSIFLGELSLQGEVRPVVGVLAAAIMAQERNIKNFFVPWQNAEEAALIPKINIYPVKNIRQLINHLTQQEQIKPFQSEPVILSSSSWPSSIDLAYVRGQEFAKRALEIAASGGHNIILSGPPGSGKTMLAKAMSTILPNITHEEMLETTRLYSVAGLLSKSQPLINFRPFRAPHHSASAPSIVGGGRIPRPGEISLAHRGVLFFDEFPEFPRQVIEALRQPLEDGIIHVSRVQGSVCFPARFIFVASMNPCPCGFKGDEQKECLCTPLQIINYQKKISGPILDRIDLHIKVPRLKFAKISQKILAEPSCQVKKRVETARKIQLKRFVNSKIFINAAMGNKEIERYCRLDSDSLNLLKAAMNKMNLSPRSYFRLIKLARTIADLASSENILSEHIAEALQYRE